MTFPLSSHLWWAKPSSISVGVRTYLPTYVSSAVSQPQAYIHVRVHVTLHATCVGFCFGTVLWPATHSFPRSFSNMLAS